MPVYEYRCAACGRTTSKFFKSQRAAAENAVSCEHCGAAGVERALSLFAYHQSLQSQIDSIDPQIERELDWADRHHRGSDPLERMNLDFTPPEG
jgi:putative FmdB family regulatory protein